MPERQTVLKWLAVAAVAAIALLALAGGVPAQWFAPATAPQNIGEPQAPALATMRDIATVSDRVLRLETSARGKATVEYAEQVAAEAKALRADVTRLQAAVEALSRGRRPAGANGAITTGSVKDKQR